MRYIRNCYQRNDARSKVPKDEPDRAFFFKGDLIYCIIRSSRTLILSCYIGLLEGHPLYEDEYNDYDVYGGMGSDEKVNNTDPLVSSLLMSDDEFKVRLLRFDCYEDGDWAHPVTLSQLQFYDDGVDEASFIQFENCPYRDMKFAIDQLDKLAVQIKIRIRKRAEERAKKMNIEKTLLPLKFHAT